jgi:hypothetical protein
MSESSITPPGAPKGRLPVFLIALGVVALMILSLSVGGLTWWLLSRRPPGVVPAPGRGAMSVASDAGFTEIFNGRDLDGWDFDPAVWSVRDGVIYGRQIKGGNLFWRSAEVEDFELRFRFRLVRGNSGIYYRARQLANFDVGGYEFEIYANKTGNLADNGSDRVKRRLHAVEAADSIDSEWHEGVIIATGPRLVHWLDGKVYCDVEDTDAAAPRKGFIALGAAGGTTVEFKDLRLKRTVTPR